MTDLRDIAARLDAAYHPDDLPVGNPIRSARDALREAAEERDKLRALLREARNNLPCDVYYCCGDSQWSGDPEEPLACCGQPASLMFDIDVALRGEEDKRG